MLHDKKYINNYICICTQQYSIHMCFHALLIITKMFDPQACQSGQMGLRKNMLTAKPGFRVDVLEVDGIHEMQKHVQNVLSFCKPSPLCQIDGSYCVVINIATLPQGFKVRLQVAKGTGAWFQGFGIGPVKPDGSLGGGEKEVIYNA